MIHIYASMQSWIFYTRDSLGCWQNADLCVFDGFVVLQWLRPVRHKITLSLTQNGRHFPDDIFKCIFLNENVWIPLKISLKFVPTGPINNIPTLVQIMAGRRPGDKPLFEPMMVYRRIYASLGLNELYQWWKAVNALLKCVGWGVGGGVGCVSTTLMSS